MAQSLLVKKRDGKFTFVTGSDDGSINVTGIVGGGNGESFIATETSAANTLATATKTAADKSLYITGYIVALRGAAAGNDVSVQVKDGSSILIQDYIGKDAPSGERIGAMLTHPIKCAGDAVLEVGAAGAGAITELTLMGYSL